MANDNLFPNAENLKHCGACKTDKPVSEFSKSKHGKNGLQSRCKDCGRAMCRDWYHRNKATEQQKARRRARINRPKRQGAWREWALANPEKAREYGRKKLLEKKYGMTIAEHDAMFAAQGLKCAACGSSAPNSKKGWSTDHCHATGKVRGIVCHHCNIGIGHAKDNIETIRSWISYLERTSGVESHAQETETARSKIGKTTT